MLGAFGKVEARSENCITTSRTEDEYGSQFGGIFGLVENDFALWRDKKRTP
jgi:hypothetical protein